jgi:L-seryl-tRNA(Ser) seleniumtransferase
MVVNNNAAATLLCLDTLATGREVIVSRGELVEIGGAFRIPDVMAKSGAILKEVGPPTGPTPGTTKTPSANRPACCSRPTPAITVSWDLPPPSPCPIGSIGRSHNLPVMEDLGSGTLVDFSNTD